MDSEQARDLAYIVSHGGIHIYTPTQRSLARYCPLQDLGYVTIRDVGSDEMQETILAVEPTAAGRAALEKH